MNFDNFMFFVIDPAKCVREEDDPADAIKIFYPFETPMNVKCSWCSQLLGLFQFWKNSFRHTPDFVKLSKHIIVLKEIDSVFVAFGRRFVESECVGVIKNEMKDCLTMIADVLRFYFGGLGGDPFGATAERCDIFSSLSRVLELPRSGLHFRLSHGELFRDALSARLQANEILQQLYFGSEFQQEHATRILCGMLSFRTDIIAEDITVRPPYYGSLFLTACMRSVFDHHGSKSDFVLPNNAELAEVRLYRVFLQNDDLKAMQLARNMRIAAGEILKFSLSASKQPPADLSNPRSRCCNSDRSAVMLCVIQTCSTFLAFLVDQSRPNSRIVIYLKEICVRLAPLMNKLDETAIKHILGADTPESMFSPNSAEDRTKAGGAFEFSRVDESFTSLPDNEEEEKFIRLAHLTFNGQSPFQLNSVLVQKHRVLCEASNSDEVEKFSIHYA